MKKESIELISGKLSRLSAIFNAQAALALSIHNNGADALSVVGESLEFAENLAYFKDMKDEFISEIMEELTAEKVE